MLIDYHRSPSAPAKTGLTSMSNKSNGAASAAGVAAERLEGRRLLAYDMALTALRTDSPFTAPGGSYDVIATLRNRGADTFSGIATVRLYLSADNVAGNADDIEAPSTTPTPSPAARGSTAGRSTTAPT